MIAQAARSRRGRRIGLGALLLAALVLIGETVGSIHAVEQPCPRGARAEQPITVHLVPSVVRHQSWVGLPADLVALEMELVACVDGRIAGRGVVDENDIERTVATVNVATHWVGALWLSGRIDEYRDPQRWLIVLPPFVQHDGADP